MRTKDLAQRLLCSHVVSRSVVSRTELLKAYRTLVPRGSLTVDNGDDDCGLKHGTGGTVWRGKPDGRGQAAARVALSNGAGVNFLSGENEPAAVTTGTPNWQADVARLSATGVGPSAREVFANTEIALNKIGVIGFDFDFTLISYRTHVQRLIYDRARQYLIDTRRYPGELASLSYDKSFAVRGLTFDKERGLLFKLGPNYRVDLSTVFKGRRRLDAEEALAAFGGVSHLRGSGREGSLVGIFDQFSLAEACLLADVCDYFNRSGISFSPAAVFQDVNESIGFVHISGQLHLTVMLEVEKYVHKNPKLRQLLLELKETGKQTFVLSNSRFDYVDVGMRYICGDDWLSLFSAVLTDAQKPSFYTSRDPFRQLDLDSNACGGASLRTKWSTVTSIEPMCAYSKGNVNDLMQLTGWKGSEILYIGDHVFADLRGPARSQGWWTGAIIRELDKEIEVERSAKYQEMAFKLQLIEEMLRRLQWAPADDNDPTPLGNVLDELEGDRVTLRSKMNALMNKNFGSVFIANAQSPSLFSLYMNRYVDLYTSRLENFIDYGPDFNYRFYPCKRKTLAHEPMHANVKQYIETTLKYSVDKHDVHQSAELSLMGMDDDDLDNKEIDREAREEGNFSFEAKKNKVVGRDVCVF